MTRARDLASYTSVQSQIAAKATAGSDGVPFRMAAGNYYHTAEYQNITFPSGRFTQPPRLTSIMVAAGVGGNTVLSANMSTNGATLQCLPLNRYVDWVAIQMTSGAASG
jgi:hypothetical protein